MHSRGYGEVSKPYLYKALFDTEVASTECHRHTQESCRSVFAWEGCADKVHDANLEVLQLLRICPLTLPLSFPASLPFSLFFLLSFSLY